MLIEGVVGQRLDENECAAPASGPSRSVFRHPVTTDRMVQNGRNAEQEPIVEHPDDGEDAVRRKAKGRACSAARRCHLYRGELRASSITLRNSGE